MNNNTNQRIDLGRIDIMRNFSFFEVEDDKAQFTVDLLNNKRWNGNKMTVEFAESKGPTSDNSTKRKKESLVVQKEDIQQHVVLKETKRIKEKEILNRQVQDNFFINE